MTLEKLRPSFAFDQDRIEQFKAIAPEAFADDKINWDILKEALGEHLEEEGTQAEHFGLFWPGKREARRLASIPSKGTLVPASGEGIDEETTRNIFIEGENLEVLKLLLKSYQGMVRMVYVDPPYNTGQDFVYDDSFTDPLEDYLRRVGQVTEEGFRLTTNTKDNGRFHANWLDMIYPRLRLAKNFLREDGLLFVSIDDNEVQHLRMVLDEIFGPENFVDTIIWKKRYGGGSKEKFLVSIHEYILVYAKAKESLDKIFVALDPESIARYYKMRDDKFELRGPYRTHPLEATRSVGARPNLVYPIPAPDGSKVLPKRQWWWDKERTMKALANNELEFIRGAHGKWTVHTKQYLRDEQGKERQTKAFSIIDDVFTQHGTAEIQEIFGDSRIFPFPKPTGLIKELMQIADVGNDDIVLDIFAGSATTAHAVLDSNEVEKMRHFICIQIPEPTPDDSYAKQQGLTTIAEIGKERVRRVISRQKKGKNKGDMGFKVYKLARSNFKAWQDYHGEYVSEIENLFSRFELALVEDWKPQDVLTEVMLIEGFPLDSKVSTQKDFQKNRIELVESPSSAHRLSVCLDEKISDATITQLNIGKDDIFVCLDSALTDESKLRLSDRCKLKVI